MSTLKLVVLALLALLALAQTTMAQDEDMMDMDMDMDDEEMRMRMMSSDEMMDEVEEMEDRQDGDWSFRADASTPGPAGAGGRDATTTGAPCVPVAKCHGHSDCGAKGKCLGINVGTCDCMACMSGSFCNLGSIVGQAPCGGLQNACNSSSNICNCEQGYQQAGGFKNFGDALVKFCGKQSCDGKTDNCFGLPCKSGMCACG